MDPEQGYRAILREFQDRYGDPNVIAQEYVKKALGWPEIKADNAKALDDFAIFMKEC